MSKRVLIAALPLRHQPGKFRDLLLEAGLEPVDPPREENAGELSDACVASLLPGCDAIIAGSEKLQGTLLEKCPKLRIIARTGVGYDAIDMPATNRLGITVTITPGVNQESVAEQAFGLLLGFTRRIAVNSADIARGGWDRTLPIPLRGKTMGLIGLGRIGQAMVPRAQSFGMKLVAFDPFLKESPFGDAVPLVSMEQVLQTADVLSLHVPITPETRHLIRSETIAKMPSGAILINTARGGLVHEPDLIAALKSGHIAGACLDVSDPEPPLPDSELRRLPNVVISPHLGGIDSRSMADMADLAAWCVVEKLSGRDPARCIVTS
jgi:phosphoglycerate dehydrogenase-like enzyme